MWIETVSIPYRHIKNEPALEELKVASEEELLEFQSPIGT